MSWVHVGFTGTRKGMTEEQLVSLRSQLALWNLLYDTWFLHHGDCIEADEQAHEIAAELGFQTIVHPPSNPRLRAFCEGDRILSPLPYLDRDREMVLVTSFLFAAPDLVDDSFPRGRGGTRYTVRFALAQGRPVRVIRPDGSVWDLPKT